MRVAPVGLGTVVAVVLLTGCSGSSSPGTSGPPSTKQHPTSPAAPSRLSPADARAAYNGGFADGTMNWQRLLTPGEKPSTPAGRTKLTASCTAEAAAALKPDKSPAYRGSWVRGCAAGVQSSFAKATA